MDRLKQSRSATSILRPSYLHSNMDRLKRTIHPQRRAGGADLHSNMDRLKLMVEYVLKLFIRIYIPIWID